jgi:putative membrane protein
MHLLSFAKGALAMFWLLALANLFVPLGQAWFWPVNLAAAAVLLAHIGEVLLLRRRLQAQPQPWLARMQVLLFGVLHIQGLPPSR